MTFPSVCPIADTYEWLPQRNIGGPMTYTQGLVLHVNAGNGDPYNWWTQPTTPIASSHFQLMKTGELIQYVALDTVAWCQVAGSSTWHSIETEGFPDEPLTAQAMAKLGSLYSWGHANCGWALQLTDDVNGAGFGWHGMGGEAWGGHTGCPGDARKAQRSSILQLAQGDPFMTMPTINANVTLDMNHPDVRSAQGILAARGAWIAPLQTNRAVLLTAIKWFQGEVKLPVDGIMGTSTWTAAAHPAGSNAR